MPHWCMICKSWRSTLAGELQWQGGGLDAKKVLLWKAARSAA
eukprot:CAMPEP_0171069454 /NCGR_PEP_ID=MMETSP0766_2-20121228/9158_1 /TAXON_ID=439317 /ORGANISM="Gambierdiscus australes, Strain CAWD 149" /LENGTH=41 /DNA_ID= /DNA_START= /DNA_END= /DNA_ORIENTATION=